VTDLAITTMHRINSFGAIKFECIVSGCEITEASHGTCVTLKRPTEGFMVLK